MNNSPSSEDEANKSRILTDPKFLKALAKHQLKKVLRLRRHPKLRKLLVRVINKPKPGWKPPRSSTPFNDETDLDPFMLFAERRINQIQGGGKGGPGGQGDAIPRTARVDDDGRLEGDDPYNVWIGQIQDAGAAISQLQGGFTGGD